MPKGNTPLPTVKWHLAFHLAATGVACIVRNSVSFNSEVARHSLTSVFNEERRMQPPGTIKAQTSLWFAVILSVYGNVAIFLHAQLPVDAG